MSSSIAVILAEEDTIHAPMELCYMSNLIQELVSNTEQDDPIPLPTLSRQYFELILRYCQDVDYTHPAPIPKPLKSSDMKMNITTTADLDYIICLEKEKLKNLTEFADYLDIQSLLDLCLAVIACEYRGKSVADVQNRLNIKDEFTRKLQKELQERYSWAFSEDEIRLQLKFDQIKY